MTLQNNTPIGVFDSGLGGLTILASLAKTFPTQSWIYLGDTARLPYGSKSAKTIRQYTLENLQYLSEKKCQAFVIACNSASAQYPEDSFDSKPVFKVIEPGVKQALLNQPKKIAILGTKATIQSGAYESLLRKKGFSGPILNQPCPLFVPLVEEGLLDHPATDLIIQEYLKRVKEETFDTVILGCTHYPLLKSAIQKFLGPTAQLASSEFFLADTMSTFFSSKQTLPPDNSIQITTTDPVQLNHIMVKNTLAGLTAKINFTNLGAVAVANSS